MKVRVELFRVNRRLRARMNVDSSIIAEWWIESADGRRYKPLKPIPPKAQYVVNMLDNAELEKLANFLFLGKEGEHIEFSLPKRW